MIKTLIVLLFVGSIVFLLGASLNDSEQTEKKPTICIIGGTPSTENIVDQIPGELKKYYNFISFNRPGFGGTPNSIMTKDKLFSLAKEAGLKKNDFGIIGISGGGPLSILIADEFKIVHCGIISGMVSKEAYFAYADSTFTKPLMTSVLYGFDAFKRTVESFPNVEEIIKQAESPKDLAVRGSYDELNFILSDSLFTQKDFNSVNITWWHGEKDKNVALESVKLFLKNFKNSQLKIIPNQSHEIDAKIYVEKIIKGWENISK